MSKPLAETGHLRPARRSPALRDEDGSAADGPGGWHLRIRSFGSFAVLAACTEGSAKAATNSIHVAPGTGVDFVGLNNSVLLLSRLSGQFTLTCAHSGPLTL